MTQLDKKTGEREDLLYKVEKLLSVSDIQQVKSFIAGLEAGKAIAEKECKRETKISG